MGVFGLLTIFSTPDHNLGGRMCIWFVLQVWRSVPMSSWPIAIKVISHLQGLRGKSLFPSRFEHVFRDVQWKKFNIQKLLQTFFPTHQESSNLKTRTRRYGRNIERRSLKSALDRLHRRSKIGTTVLFGTRFMRMMARWKDNFINFNFEGFFTTCSVQEVQGKLWKMRQRQGRDGSQWWRYDEGLEPWLDDNKKNLKGKWVTKTRSEDSSQTHGNRGLLAIQVIPHLATR
jgi:hypothetical protein